MPGKSGTVHYPIIAQRGNSVADFVPKGWHVLAEANGQHVVAEVHGDLAGNKRSDVALVIEYDKDLKAKDSPIYQHKPRIFLVLFKTVQGGYVLSMQSNNLIRCADEGGFFGDPFDGISINRGSVVVHFYGGSNFRWDWKPRFRYKDHGWYLIDLTDLENSTINDEMVEYDYNLLTGKMKVTKGSNFDQKKRVISWLSPGKRKVRLIDYHTWFESVWQKMT